MADPELLFEAEGLYENLTAEEYEDFLNGEHQYNYFAILYMVICFCLDFCCYLYFRLSCPFHVSLG
jgi:hypothetical protein